MNLQSAQRNMAKAIAYCCSKAGDSIELKLQEEKILSYAEAQGYMVSEIFMETGTTDSLTYRSFRLRAKYREFNALLISELDVLGNSPIEITQEIIYLNDNCVKVISLKEGELTADTLPNIFRKKFKFV